MTTSNDLALLTIEKLFSENSHYVIPIYQRNYAWGAAEIEQLIQDIADGVQNLKKTGEQKEAKYYLGSLVVYIRDGADSPHKDAIVYETIDGQQRHTTLSILLAYLKTVVHSSKQALSHLDLNLDFDSRPKSARTLQNLFQQAQRNDPEEPSIRAAFSLIEHYFKTHNIDTSDFCQYLLKHVTILRVPVPKDTDLNHYFEIMNNRGEQLEKHEVLKAYLMSVYNGDTASRNSFSAIWDACADMGRYVQLGFSPEARKVLFGEKWSGFRTDFEAIKCVTETHHGTDEKPTLRNIIGTRRFHYTDNDNEKVKEQRFDSIIDFSNFLLHVLKVTVADTVSLDDKKLLQAFEIIKNDREKITQFAFDLLKFRVLFDRYIIKRDQDEKWSLLTLEYYARDRNSSFSYNNSFDQYGLSGVNRQLTMILSMFHVSHPAYVYKRWLNRSLVILNGLASNELDINGTAYLEALEKLSCEFLAEICGEKGQFNAEALHRGTGVQNYVFNLLDYRLWRDLTAGQSFDGKGANHPDIKKHFEDFQFSPSRTSVEHYFPQTDPSGANKMGNDVHRFGNLCLISPSSNSRLSNYSPADKKKFYAETERSESLKQAIMMSYEEWGPERQGIKNIESHEEVMLALLSGDLSMLL
ncbi:GmrSD restriction endonuclease domain-containing protein [Klebsiella michiganensis]|uniref:GmrSD restriction endonuclease domain-containing protein n=1 Tax=Klebsiella michiganensis TaxID=1134687 RepID=UPI00398ABECA